MTGMMRVRYHDAGDWAVFLYDRRACKTSVHLMSMADADAALARGDIGESEAANARTMFRDGARQVIVGPVNA
jgi:hypothetical protein